MLDKNTLNNKTSHMFQIKPEKHWKFIEFDRNNRDIDGEEYYYEKFVNSEKFIIHDVTTVVDLNNSYARTYYHVWYEPKGD